ncbi:hypothetical protein [Planctomycetes bacterium K23_9]|uniref:Uncharacterized protein n=1 Tax=Stieleria marina TaxID=1930275 RepID=A0A517NWM6_9BACT|nr:hypothetical protein K239x_35190 [Planctomycetes bacterium K23_9]
MKNASDREDFYQEIPSKFGLYFILFVIGGFGAMATLAALTRNFRDADDWFLLIMGVMVLLLAMRLYQIACWPSFSLTQDELIIRKWLGTRKFLYSDIESLSDYQEWTKARRTHSGTKTRPILIHYLEITLRSGKTKTYPLPTYHTNQGLLESISRRTRREIRSLGIKGDG